MQGTGFEKLESVACRAEEELAGRWRLAFLFRGEIINESPWVPKDTSLTAARARSSKA